jgi:hypothetical protein
VLSSRARLVQCVRSPSTALTCLSSIFTRNFVFTNPHDPRYPYYCYNASLGDTPPFPTALECNGGNAEGFYAALLTFARYWNQTWTSERAMDLTLPTHGIDVAAFVKHSVARMMITRRDMYHPRYGKCSLFHFLVIFVGRILSLLYLCSACVPLSHHIACNVAGSLW